ncbi:hypothetical protein FC87_GL000787 [Fructilactobacillus florum DSM 22689 = JCM 16035]|nr:hypothetical protein FC87_GL000787 [Fructilactobacillus florum DSM 22689 = JCM 16035]
MIAKLLNDAINVYVFLIIIDALMSWLPGAPSSKLGQLITRLVTPFLKYFEFARIGIIGFGPILAVIALGFIQIGVNGIANFLITIF